MARLCSFKGGYRVIKVKSARLRNTDENVKIDVLGKIWVLKHS